GTQTYNDAVSLTSDATLASSGAAAAGNITFAGTVDGAKNLTVNTAGTTAFQANVGNTTALVSLTTNAGGTTTIGTGTVPVTVKTSGTQTYNDAVSLLNNTTL